MTPAQLDESVLTAAAAVLSERGLDRSLLPASATVQRPRNPEHGDYASTLALQLAGRAGLPAPELARAIAGKLTGDPAIRSVDIAGPGFLNIRLHAAAAGQIAGQVIGQGSRYGHGSALAGQRLNLEFVSPNPVGPVHVGAGRWVAVGDALARLLRAQGATVGTEYYFNDAGAAGLPDDAALKVLRTAGVELMFGQIKTSLADFGVRFDRYFAEQDLHDSGQLDAALDRLSRAGHTYRADGATWVRTTQFGDDKDRVYVRGNGDYTYFAADCAYYLDKRARGFGKVIIILGADHHGYLGRMRAMAACFGDDPGQTLEILIGQLVSLFRDGQPVRLSKRAGTVITLADLTDAIGTDAARYALARYSMDAPIELDLGLWARRSNDNPVYYVQYAHARICSLLRRAAIYGIDRGPDYDPALLTHPRENDLAKALAAFPGVVAKAAGKRQPHRVARYLEGLAGAYHRFHDTCRILPRGGEPAAGPALTGARLWLASATRVVLANGLDLLGVTAPDRL